MKRLVKSNTFLAGSGMATVLTSLAMYREPIVSTLDIVIGVGKGEAVFTTITAIVGLLGTFGVGKGRLDAEHKVALHAR